MLDLERLRQVAADLDRLGPRNLDPLELFVLLDDLGHFGLDLGEVLFAQFVRQVEVVIEAVVDRGAKGQLHPFEQPHHGPGHHVRARMAHDAQRFGIFARQQLERRFALGRQRADRVDHLAVDLGR